MPSTRAEADGQAVGWIVYVNRAGNKSGLLQIDLDALHSPLSRDRGGCTNPIAGLDTRFTSLSSSDIINPGNDSLANVVKDLGISGNFWTGL